MSESAAATSHAGRLFLEGLVIIVSILIAFWIDAMWELTRDREQALEHLAAVHQELLDNVDLLEGHVAGCERESGPHQINRRLLTVMGPDPGPIAADSAVALLGGPTASPPPPLRVIAFNSMVASGALADVGSPDLQSRFREWEALLEARQRRLDVFNATLERTFEALIATGLFGPISEGSRTRLPPSRGPRSAEALLSDPVLEGWMRYLAIRRGQICIDDVTRATQADSLAQVVAAELAR